MNNQAEANSRFVEFALDVNSWANRLPDVITSRPSRCPRCGVPGRLGDGRVILHGHGLRTRTLLGPPDADGRPCEISLELRRYACQRCQAVITVGPLGLLARRRYTAMAIGLALWLWAVLCCNDAQVRLAISPCQRSGEVVHLRSDDLAHPRKRSRDPALEHSPHPRLDRIIWPTLVGHAARFPRDFGLRKDSPSISITCR